MDAFSGYIYAALWLIIAVYLFFYAFKSHKFLFFLSGYFLFMSGWYLTDQLLVDVNLFSGMYSWIFRGIALVVLIISVLVYFYSKKKRLEQGESSENGKE